MNWDQLIGYVVGPGGALVVLFLSVWSLWKAHRSDDARRDGHLERQISLNEEYAKALPPLTEAVNDAIAYISAPPEGPAPR